MRVTKVSHITLMSDLLTPVKDDLVARRTNHWIREMGFQSHHPTSGRGEACGLSPLPMASDFVNHDYVMKPP